MHSREFERHTFVSTAELLLGDRKMPCEVCNLSLGGAMVRVGKPLPQGRALTLSMEPFGKLAATAVWNRDDTSGIKFTDSAEVVGEVLAAMAIYSGA